MTVCSPYSAVLAHKGNLHFYSDQSGFTELTLTACYYIFRGPKNSMSFTDLSGIHVFNHLHLVT
jgi:hypothetical protein